MWSVNKRTSVPIIMDIFSHGLWAGAAYKAINKKRDNKINVKAAAFWGVFPDLFAFTIPFVWLLWNLVFGHLNFGNLPHPSAGEPPQQDTLWVFRLASSFYTISHSAVVFAALFLFVWLIFRKPMWALGGWLLHILIDIPTHTYQFYPTPVFWPISGLEFNGFSWATPWFLIINYSIIIIVYWFLRERKTTKKAL